jgi:hypothetical protein
MTQAVSTPKLMQVAVKDLMFHRSEAARQDVVVRVALKAMVPLEVEEATLRALVIDPYVRTLVDGYFIWRFVDHQLDEHDALVWLRDVHDLRLRHPAHRVPHGRNPPRHARLSGRLQAQGARQLTRRPGNRDAREAVGIKGPRQRRWCGLGARILQAASIARFLHVLERLSSLRR